MLLIPIRRTWREDRRQVRIAAIAEYLIGVPMRKIEIKYNIMSAEILYYLKKTKHFKLRRIRRTSEQIKQQGHLT